MLKTFLRPALLGLLLHVQSLTAEETVNGATGAINSTIPTSTENEATIYTILVGKEHNIYTPNSINPGPGDIVSFQFYPGNHSVIRAEYGYPCIPYEDLQGKENQGFYSGEMAVSEDQVNEGNLPVWNLTINTTTPTFFYCGSAGGCAGWGMIGAFNADSEHSIATQIKIAREAEYVLTPGQSLPADVSTSMVSLAASATTVVVFGLPTPDARSTSAAPAGTETTGQASAQKETGSSSLSAGAIVGSVIGGVALLAIASGLFCKSKPLKTQTPTGLFACPECYYAVLSGRSQALSEQLRQYKRARSSPPNSQSEPFRTHSGLPPAYAYNNPQPLDQRELSFPVEADGMTTFSYGQDSPFPCTPKAYHAELPGELASPQSQSPLQHEYQRMNMNPEQQNSHTVHEIGATNPSADSKEPLDNASKA